LKALLVQRKKLRKAQKARQRAAAKERKARNRTAAAVAKDARPEKPAGRTPKGSKNRPAKKPTKGRSRMRPQSTASTSNAETRPVTQPDSGVATGGFQESAGTPQQDLE
jgi:hypothetical protein